MSDQYILCDTAGIAYGPYSGLAAVQAAAAAMAAAFVAERPDLHEAACTNPDGCGCLNAEGRAIRRFSWIVMTPPP